MTLDGYQIDIPCEMIEKYDPILATHFNSVPVSIGQLGPTLVVFPEVDDADLAQELEALSVYEIVFIGVQ
jgi:hypothetical protein